MKFEAVIFDFNGTLFFDNDKHTKAWNAMSLKLRQCPITDEELHTKFNGVPNQKIIEYMTNNKASEKEKKTPLEQFHKIQARSIRELAYGLCNELH